VGVADGDWVTAFGPASIGNMAVGFDMLGLALAGAGDRVSARRTDTPGISVTKVLGLDGNPHPYLSTDPKANTASIAAQALWDVHGHADGAELIIAKGVPLQSGMGSSAASAVAAVVAVNALLESPLAQELLLPYALEGEKYASGGLHADNVAPSLLGGLVFCPATLLPETITMPVPAGVSAVLLHPELQVNTAHSRRALATDYSMQQWLSQQAHLAGFVAACYRNDLELLRATFKDVVIEPQRAQFVSCFDNVRDAAMQTKAIGCSLSGSGPSIFALVEDQFAGKLAGEMEQACRDMGIDCQSWISPMTAPGASVES
jgi:homoserine kinase